MTTYNTGNPLGSSDPRDLYDNAENSDEAVNSTASDTWVDRLGKSRLTWAGMENQFDADQAGRESEFNADQSSREQQFRTFIASSGYQFSGDYAAGIEITQYNQLVRDENGEFWRVSGQVDLPYTTTGAGLPEDDSLIPVGDAALRSTLNTAPEQVVRNMHLTVPDVNSLLTGEYKIEGLLITTLGFRGGSKVGGMTFTWEPSVPKSLADGGVIIDPDLEVTDNIESYLESQGSGEGFGCFVATGYHVLHPENFGAFTDNAGATASGTCDRKALNKAAEAAAREGVALEITGKHRASGYDTSLGGFSTFSVRLPTGITLNFGKDAAIFFDGSGDVGNFAGILVNDVSGVVVNNARLVGDAALYDESFVDTEQQHGIAIQHSSKDIKINSPVISHFRGDGIIVRSSSARVLGAAKDAPIDIVLENPNISHCFRQGISITSTLGCEVVGGKASYISGKAPSAGIDIEPPGPNYPCTNINISDFEARECAGQGLLVALTYMTTAGSPNINIVVERFKSIDNTYGIRVASPDATAGGLVGVVRLTDCLVDGVLTGLDTLGEAFAVTDWASPKCPVIIERPVVVNCNVRYGFTVRDSRAAEDGYVYGNVHIHGAIIASDGSPGVQHAFYVRAHPDRRPMNPVSFDNPIRLDVMETSYSVRNPTVAGGGLHSFKDINQLNTRTVDGGLGGVSIDLNSYWGRVYIGGNDSVYFRSNYFNAVGAEVELCMNSGSRFGVWVGNSSSEGYLPLSPMGVVANTVYLTCAVDYTSLTLKPSVDRDKTLWSNLTGHITYGAGSGTYVLGKFESEV